MFRFGGGAARGDRSLVGIETPQLFYTYFNNSKSPDFQVDSNHGCSGPSRPMTTYCYGDTIRAMAPEMLFDYLPIRLNGPKAARKKLVLNVSFTDPKSQYVLTLENAVLNYAADRQDLKADATLTLSKATLNAVQLRNPLVRTCGSKGKARGEECRGDRVSEGAWRDDGE